MLQWIQNTYFTVLYSSIYFYYQNSHKFFFWLLTQYYSLYVLCWKIDSTLICIYWDCGLSFSKASRSVLIISNCISDESEITLLFPLHTLTHPSQETLRLDHKRQKRHREGSLQHGEKGSLNEQMATQGKGCSALLINFPRLKAWQGRELKCSGLANPVPMDGTDWNEKLTLPYVFCVYCWPLLHLFYYYVL